MSTDLKTFAEQMTFQRARKISSQDLMQNGIRRLEEIDEEIEALYDRRKFIASAVEEAPTMFAAAEAQLLRLVQLKSKREAKGGSGAGYGRTELEKRVAKQAKIVAKIDALRSELEADYADVEMPAAVAEVLG